MSQLIEDYLAGPAALRKAVAGLSREQFTARPIAGKWSTLEVVCHLADFEPIFAERIKRMVTHDRPAIASANENLFAAGLVYHERDAEEELTLIEKTRSQMGRILRALPPESLKRVGIHSERGELTVERILQMSINHIAHHLPFILEKRKALGLPS